MKKGSYKTFYITEAASFLEITQSQMSHLWSSGQVESFEFVDIYGEMRRACYQIDLDKYKESKK